MIDGDSLDFLRLLKPSRLRDVSEANFLFEIIREPEDVLVRTINPTTAQPEDFNPELFSGEVGRMLMLMERAGGYPFKSSKPVSIYSDTLLASRLAECPNVVLRGNVTPIRKADIVRSELILRIEPVVDNETLLKPTLLIRNSDGSATDDFFMLSDIIACDGHSFFFVDNVGENFAQLHIFLHEFPASMLTDYVSIFLTYIRNVRLKIPGRKIVYGDTVSCVPTIVIKKMDEDNALYISGCSSPPGKDVSFMPGLQTTVLVRDDGANILSIYPLEYQDNSTITKALYDVIVRYAPNRTEAGYIYSDSTTIIVPEQTASNFLLKGLPALLKDYKIVGLDRIKDFRIRPVSPRINLRLSSGINFLEGTADVQIEGQTFTIRDLLAQYAANKYVTLQDGSRGVIDEKFIRRIERIFGTKVKDDKVTVSFFDLPEIEEYIQKLDSNSKVLKRPREFYNGFNDLAKQKLRIPRINAQLRHYQKDGVKWLKYLYDNNMGGCLADDMGLGKTLQVISLVDLYIQKSKLPTLIVMPRSLVFNWEKEFRKFAPHIDFAIYHGASRDFDQALRHQVILTTYAMVRNDIEKFKERDFEAVILDESQTIKNIDALQTKAVMLLNAKHRFALSGTPVENNLSELYSLFRFINPGMFGSFDDFQSRYLLPIQRDHDEEALASLRRKIFPFMLRRLKKDVLTDLPDRIDNTIYVDMDDEQRRYYEQRRKFYLDRMHETIAEEGLTKAQFVMFQAISELRRIASVPESLTDGRIASPKLELLIDQISQAVENGHKVVVFFNFVAGLELLAERLNALGINTETMTGATRDRKAIISAFQDSDDCKVLAMTLKTGGVGLNLTAADIVFIAEPWWNRAAQEQAINRLYRIGQKNTVFSYSLITRDTIEEKIEVLQQQKADLFEDVIASDESTAKKLTQEDIDFILS